jgi:hypothetical protein
MHTIQKELSWHKEHTSKRLSGNHDLLMHILWLFLCQKDWDLNLVYKKNQNTPLHIRKSLVEATNYNVWIQNLFKELRLMENHCLELYYDNQSTEQMARNLLGHGCTKHIDIHHHLIMNKVWKEELKLFHTLIKENIVDIFTKPLECRKIWIFLDCYGTCESRLQY